jgi:sec-independent protein translocase protein TatA
MSFGPMEILLILGIVLIFFGPSRLPGLGKSIGEAIKGFKHGLNDNSRDVTESSKLKEAEEAEKKKNS